MIELSRCACCGTLRHPPRILCPACGAGDWVVEARATGIVEQCTAVAGPRPDAGPVVLASVRCAEAVVIAALPAAVEPGAVVALDPGPGRSVLGRPVAAGDESGAPGAAA